MSSKGQTHGYRLNRLNHGYRLIIEKKKLKLTGKKRKEDFCNSYKFRSIE